jgi:hypothetical protein
MTMRRSLRFELSIFSNSTVSILGTDWTRSHSCRPTEVSGVSRPAITASTYLRWNSCISIQQKIRVFCSMLFTYIHIHTLPDKIYRSRILSRHTWVRYRKCCGTLTIFTVRVPTFDNFRFRFFTSYGFSSVSKP